MIILAGTQKGLVILEVNNRDEIKLLKTCFEGFDVTMTSFDKRNNRIWVGISHKHWGQKIHYSDDLGNSWSEGGIPSFEGLELPGGKPARLRQIWCMAHGGKDNPDCSLLGTEPGAVFRTVDGGKTFNMVEGLWNHPTRSNPAEWFGAGADQPFVHTILIDPKDSSKWMIAVSCAGIFVTEDAGETWSPRNNGLKAFYLPDPTVAVGHDPHGMAMDTENPEIIWQQNHCGVFLTRDFGKSWTEIMKGEGRPDYGFAIAADPKNSARCWVIPVESDIRRVPQGLKLEVLETTDYGLSWTTQNHGLPAPPVFDIVLRDGFKVLGEIMVMGTTNGHIYWSSIHEVSWREAGLSLVKINSITLFG